MRLAIVSLCAVLGVALAGCVTDSDGCSTDTCRAQMAAMRRQGIEHPPPANPTTEHARQRAAAEARQRADAEAQERVAADARARAAAEAQQRAAAEAQARAAAEACVRADANPAAADPATVKRCRAQRIQQSGIMCTDNRTGDRFIDVTCEAPFRSGQPDTRTVFEMVMQRAAMATVAAGFTHLVFAGEQPPETRYLPQPDAPRTCRQVFNKVTCTSDGAPPAPASVIYRHRFELLTETEALGRVNPHVPPPRQPQAAVQITQTYGP